ncbi:unnamed protein product [Linum trigynum]|uniref:Uncharacterized protein n=1 Tax=Linum trigynum TaxID=586398 RepID=A0AAV2EWT4_9ROSI
MADELASLSPVFPHQGEYPEVEEEDFYEQISAPKYVDLTKPDPRRSSEDRYWFCLRVGCDQKHEEEMDSEAIYKNFVLRVMAARSPNVKLRKALCNKEKSHNLKCPQTVPAKPSRPRGPRLALISSISKKLVDNKAKLKPLQKQTATTPKAMAKQSSNMAKALTTPRNKKPAVSEPAAVFRSVRAPKSTALVGLPKKMGTARTLVFHSPKKQVRIKTPSEGIDSMKTLCSGMKKLEITSGNKQMMRSTTAVSDAKRKQPRGREVKSRVYDGLLHTPTKVAKQAKSSKCLEGKNLETSSMMLQPDYDHAACKGVQDDSSNELDTEEKCRNGPQGMNANESRASGQENVLDAVMEEGFEEIKMTDQGAITSASSGGENHFEVAAEGDKENVSASDENRRLDHNADRRGKNALENQNNLNGRKTRRIMAKPLKESSVAPAAVVARSLNHRKPKPTHPKPFRLRTDERGILKEANLEKKLHPTLKELTTVPQRRHQHVLQFQRNEKNLEQTELGSNTHEGNETEEINSRPQKEQPQNEASGLRNPKGISTPTPNRQHTLSSQKKVVAVPRRTPSKAATTGHQKASRTPLKKAKTALVQ